MATIATAGDGNWSSAGTWSGGVPPTTGDVADINHNVTLDMDATVDQLDVQAGKTLTMTAGYGISGMTANGLAGSGSVTNPATIYMAAGCHLRWNSASNLGPHMSYWNIVARGTSGSKCLIDNDGSGGVDYDTAGAMYCALDLEWTQLHSLCSTFFLTTAASRQGVSLRLEDCDLEGLNTSQDIYLYGGVFRRCFFSNLLRTMPYSLAIIEDCTWGVDEDGNSQPNGSGFPEIYLRNNCGKLLMRNIRLLSPVNVGWESQFTDQPCPLTIENYGYANGTGDPGTMKIFHPNWTAERSTSAKKAGDYGWRITPSANYILTPEERAGTIEFFVPIESGQDVSVSGYLRRHGMTDDCAEIIIDPERAWFDTTVNEAPTLTSADTWYEVTPTTGSAGARGTGLKGMCRIVVYLYEYAASSYLDVADFVITVA